MTDETLDVRELELTKLGPDGAEARLTLADDRLVIETAEDSPMPEWLRGEVPFDGLDIVYVDPSEEEAEKDEEPEEKPLPPGLRVERWIEMPAANGDGTFPRKAMIAVDGGHAHMETAQAFAATFARLAGREKPEEEPVEEVAVEAEELPTGAPEPVAATEAAPEPTEEAPAFVPPAREEPAAFARSDEETAPAFAAPEEETKDDTPAFAPPKEESPAFAAADEDDDTPAFAPPESDDDKGPREDQ